MDACKAAVKRLRNSPAAVRRKIHGHGSSSSLGRRHKLREDWLNENDAVVAGVTFFVKFLGSVETPCLSGQGCTDEAVRQITASAKRQNEKLEKITLRVSSKSISMSKVGSEATRALVYPIYKVTYCTVDSDNDRVFAFIAQCPKTMKILCYAFLCNKKSKALAITLTVAQAFNMAYEMWETKKEMQKEQHPSARLRALSDGDRHQVSNGHGPGSNGSPDPTFHYRTISTGSRPALISDSDVFGHSTPDGMRSSSDTAISDDELDAEFTRLALSRSTPNLLDIGKVQIQPPQSLDVTDGPEDGEKIEEFKNGEHNPAILYRMISREDLLSPGVRPVPEPGSGS